MARPAAPPEPPSYTPSPEVPHYSPDVSEDEYRLGFSPQTGTASGTLLLKSGGISLVFHEQENTAELPTYHSRTGTICGRIHLDSHPTVQSVIISVEGQQTVVTTTGGAGGSDQQELFTITQTIWSYQVGQINYELPPTFTVDFPGSPGFYARCKYTFSAIITRSGIGGFGKRTKTITTSLCFHPHSRPHLPIINDLALGSPAGALMTSNWHEITSIMRSKDEVRCQPIMCHFYVPSVQIYALVDTVPFRIQLRSSPTSLFAFWFKFASLSPLPAAMSTGRPSLPSPIPNRSLARVFSGGTEQNKPPSAHLPSHPENGTIRVYLLRQICAQIKDQKDWKEVVIGEGKVWPVNTAPASIDEFGEQCLDWEGETKCSNDVAVGSFSSGVLCVKDFIVFELRPPNRSESQLLTRLKYMHPIVLVTDPYPVVYQWRGRNSRFRDEQILRTI